MLLSTYLDTRNYGIQTKECEDQSSELSSICQTCIDVCACQNLYLYLYLTIMSNPRPITPPVCIYISGRFCLNFFTFGMNISFDKENYKYIEEQKILQNNQVFHLSIKPTNSCILLSISLLTISLISSETPSNLLSSSGSALAGSTASRVPSGSGIKSVAVSCI